MRPDGHQPRRPPAVRAAVTAPRCLWPSRPDFTSPWPQSPGQRRRGDDPVYVRPGQSTAPTGSAAPHGLRHGPRRENGGAAGWHSGRHVPVVSWAGRIWESSSSCQKPPTNPSRDGWQLERRDIELKALRSAVSRVTVGVAHRDLVCTQRPAASQRTSPESSASLAFITPRGRGGPGHSGFREESQKTSRARPHSALEMRPPPSAGTSWLQAGLSQDRVVPPEWFCVANRGGLCVPPWGAPMPPVEDSRLPLLTHRPSASWVTDTCLFRWLTKTGGKRTKKGAFQGEGRNSLRGSKGDLWSGGSGLRVPRGPQGSPRALSRPYEGPLPVQPGPCLWTFVLHSKRSASPPDRTSPSLCHLLC